MNEPVTACPQGERSEVQQMRAMLLQSEKLAILGQVVAGVAHEINNRLTGIMSLSEMLLLQPETPLPQRDDLRCIVEEASRCGAIVRNLLNFARHHEPAWIPLSIPKALKDARILQAYRLRITGIQVVEECDADIPAIVGDANQIQQVFLNLIVNAQHAMEGAATKTLTIRTRMVARPGPDRRADRRGAVDQVVQVAITDTGTGIPEDLLPKIFEPFFTTKERGQGSGLGLSISHGIVTEHGGRLYAQSEEGRGATFFVELPILDNGTENGVRHLSEGCLTPSTRR
jgi:two-component system NtrC family sensor kinase